MYGDVRFKLGGSSYTARYSNAAWDDAKSALGVASEVECVRLAASEAEFVVLAWAGLRHYHPDLGFAAVAHLIRLKAGEGETLVRDACLSAIDASLPEPKPSKKKADDKKEQPKPDYQALRREAFKVGMSPTEFSAVTPREAVMVIEAYEWQQAQASRLAVTTAWHTEMFARQKRLKPLRDALSKIGRATPTSAKAAAAERAESALSYFRRAKAAKASAKGSRARE